MVKSLTSNLGSVHVPPFCNLMQIIKQIIIKFLSNLQLGDIHLSAKYFFKVIETIFKMFFCRFTGKVMTEKRHSTDELILVPYQQELEK